MTGRKRYRTAAIPLSLAFFSIAALTMVGAQGIHNESFIQIGGIITKLNPIGRELFQHPSHRSLGAITKFQPRSTITRIETVSAQEILLAGSEIDRDYCVKLTQEELATTFAAEVEAAKKKAAEDAKKAVEEERARKELEERNKMEHARLDARGILRFDALLKEIFLYSKAEYLVITLGGKPMSAVVPGPDRAERTVLDSHREAISKFLDSAKFVGETQPLFLSNPPFRIGSFDSGLVLTLHFISPTVFNTLRSTPKQIASKVTSSVIFPALRKMDDYFRNAGATKYFAVAVTYGTKDFLGESESAQSESLCLIASKANCGAFLSGQISDNEFLARSTVFLGPRNTAADAIQKIDIKIE